MSAPNHYTDATPQSTRRPSRDEEHAYGNLILSSVPARELDLLAPWLAPVSLRVGQVVHEAHKPIVYAFFPSSGLISLVVPMRDGNTVEVGMIGREGFLGASLLLGVGCPVARAVVQIEGKAMRVRADELRRVLKGTPALQTELQRWLENHLTEIAQCAACNSVHPIRQRISRWLLMSCTRTGTDLLAITQDTLAQVLGCRRSSVSAAARVLQRANAIDYSRGRVRILNRSALEASACECFAVLQERPSPVAGRTQR